MAKSYDWYWAALEGTIGPIVETEPEFGFYRLRNGDPVAIFPDEKTNALRIVIRGIDIAPESMGAFWLQCAKTPVTEENWRHRIAHGAWLTDPPADVKPSAPQPDLTAPPPAKGSVPGDNSGDPTSFDAMRANLEGEVAEARAYYANPSNAITSKDRADKLENWRKRIYDGAKAMDDKRKADKKPWQDKADAVDALFFPVIRSAQEFSGRNGPLDKMGQGFIAAEEARLRKEAAERAAAEHAARVAAVEAERKRLEEERAQKLADEPTLALTDPEPDLPDPAAVMPLPVEVPKVMIGTSGSRRGAQSVQSTAVINDPKALALHLVAQRHPDLMECLQRIANAAARSRARTTLPGCRMSWESGRAA